MAAWKVVLWAAYLAGQMAETAVMLAVQKAGNSAEHLVAWTVERWVDQMVIPLAVQTVVRKAALRVALAATRAVL